ncbi:damaged DNA-binding protein [Trifolium pratense]|uniref:Damaged DNA-binding protein n=1 Tax=Trifolium pratense TaxID=57577 RepID=A0A2K3LLV0_TRIPR|nr:damaged DNA-binding protein [Trifolium pratense]
MAPVTRRTSFPKVVIERDSDSEQSSSDEEQEEDETLEEEQEQEEENGVIENAKIEKLEVGFDANRKGKTPITLTLRKVCKVCKKPGHEAGFKGATYIDCPMKPCFLCKIPGHRL